jgi:hypothetical protein
MTELHPPVPLCFARLFKKAFDGEDLKPLRDQLIAELQSNSVDAAASALLSLCTIEQLLDDPVSGLARQAEALKFHRLYRSSWPASPNALRVLAFKAPGDVSTNTPIELILENLDIVLYSLYVVPGQPFPELPEHDIAIVTIGESDENRPILEELERLLASWPCPVLNRPDRAAQLTREGMYALVQGIPGLFMPPTARISRVELEKLGNRVLHISQFLADTNFPLIARPIGSHGGRGLVKLETAGAIASYLAAQPETEFSISPYVDYSSADGQFRKYRVFWIDGRPFPGHLAVTDQWKVWYYTAGMANSPAKRADEEQFMSHFDEGFGRRHAPALAGMAERFGLEYFGVDCAELPDGRLLVFEGGICLAVHDLDPPDVYPYKSGPMQKSFAAFFDMLKRKSRSHTLPAEKSADGSPKYL